MLFLPLVRLADQPLDVMKERRELQPHRRPRSKPQRPLPHIERMPVIGNDQRLRRGVVLAMHAKRALEGAALRILIATAEDSLTSIEHLEREWDRPAEIVDETQRRRRIDLGVE